MVAVPLVFASGCNRDPNAGVEQPEGRVEVQTNPDGFVPPDRRDGFNRDAPGGEGQ
jgi:hypothetical protein